jgi:hypothetical protein
MRQYVLRLESVITKTASVVIFLASYDMHIYVQRLSNEREIKLQTFVPFADIKKCAEVLDLKRLGKQRSESKIILQTLAKKATAPESAKIGWKNHPAVLMWEGHEDFLRLYSISICREWISRGCADTTLLWFMDGFTWDFKPSPPLWWGDERVHLSHRSKLLSKNHAHYTHYFQDTPNNLDYYWPL